MSENSGSSILTDTKYIVFQRHGGSLYNRIHAIPDAVVIRMQDQFAGPAMHAYADQILLAITLLESFHANPDQIKRLYEIADYFHERASQADDIKASGKAKLPD